MPASFLSYPNSSPSSVNGWGLTAVHSGQSKGGQQFDRESWTVELEPNP